MQVLRQQNWRSDYVRSSFQNAVLTGEMGGFCLHENHNYKVTGIDIDTILTQRCGLVHKTAE